jgi:hypothetical protein
LTDHAKCCADRQKAEKLSENALQSSENLLKSIQIREKG